MWIIIYFLFLVNIYFQLKLKMALILIFVLIYSEKRKKIDDYIKKGKIDKKLSDIV